MRVGSSGEPPSKLFASVLSPLASLIHEKGSPSVESFVYNFFDHYPDSLLILPNGCIQNLSTARQNAPSRYLFFPSLRLSRLLSSALSSRPLLYLSLSVSFTASPCLTTLSSFLPFSSVLCRVSLWLVRSLAHFQAFRSLLDNVQRVFRVEGPEMVR